MPHKSPSFRGGSRDLSLNVESKNFWTAQSVLVIYGSNNAAARKRFGPEGQNA